MLQKYIKLLMYANISMFNLGIIFEYIAILYCIAVNKNAI